MHVPLGICGAMVVRYGWRRYHRNPLLAVGRLSAIALCARGEMTVWRRKCKVKRWFYLLKIFSIPPSFKKCIYDLDFACSGL